MMTEIGIIKELFKASSNHKEIKIVLSDGNVATGIIQYFDGEKISIFGIEYALNEIVDIMQSEEISEVNDKMQKEENTRIHDLVGQFVRVRIKNEDADETIEGLLFATETDKILILDSNYKRILSIDEVSCVEKLDSEREQECYREPNEFEKAVINALRDDIEVYISNPDRLMSLGYTVEEIVFITSVSLDVIPWNDSDKTKLYNQARRIYTFEQNKNQQAKRLFAAYLNEIASIGKLKVKAVNALIDIVEKETPEELFSLY